MADKATLSKHKYIYKVYQDRNDCIHCERFPVVYINSKYVYFECASKQPLEFISTEMVLDSVERLMEKNTSLGKDLTSGITYHFFWEVSESPEETMKALREAQNASKRAREIENAERGLKYAQMQLNLAQERLDKLKNFTPRTE